MAESSQRDRDWELRVFEVLECDSPTLRKWWHCQVEGLDSLARARRLHDFVQKTAYERWSPMLREYAVDCRLRTSGVSPQSLNDADQEKRRILRELLQARRDLLPSLNPQENCAAIACIEPCAMTDLLEMYEPTPDVACLTPAERTVWQSEIYDGRVERELGYWWCNSHWWTITETPTDDPWYSSLPANIRNETGSWIVSEGHSLGSLCGSGTDNVWIWDGKSAIKSHTESVWTS